MILCLEGGKLGKVIDLYFDNQLKAGQKEK